jgi:Tol biopolymer transport system component/DNA-binding winged helix-turn-helix (wHTH) protein
VFGPFEYDDSSGELRKHGTRIRLQGQPLQILSSLFRQAGQVVSREEFQQQLWQGSTFVDFEHGLNAAVNRLRQVLGDSAEQPRYIETIPGRGYRFIAAFQVASPKPVPVIAAPPVGDEILTAATRPIKRKRVWVTGIAAGVLISGLAIGYMIDGGDRQDRIPPPLQFSFAPPNGYVLEPASSRQSFALSPDGSRLAFTAMDASGLLSVFVRDFRTLEARPVANSAGAHSVFWGPDERSIYFTARGNVRRATLEGDSYQVVSGSPAIISSVVSLPSGNLLLSGATGTFTVSASGGALQPVKESYRWSQVLPDSKHILHTVFDPAIGRHRARVARFGEPGTTKNLLETDSRTLYAPTVTRPGSGYLMSVRAGDLLAHPFDLNSLRVTGAPIAVARKVYTFFNTGAADFSVSSTGVLAYLRYVGRSQLAWLDRKGEIIKRIGPAGVNLKYATLAPDGRKIATSILDPVSGIPEIWIIDTATDAARRMFAGPALSVSPVWSPDSQKLVYGRGIPGSGPKLFIRGIGDSEKEEALPPDFFQVPTDWSRDGRFVAFTNTGFIQVENEFKGDIRLVDLARNRQVVPLLSTPFHEASPAFSPDGQWLAFTSNESGRTEVYLQAFQVGDSPNVSGERFLVSRHGAACLRWRRDGRELFYVGADGRLYSVPVKLSKRPDIGTPVAMFDISLEARGALHAPLGFDISADGNRFLAPIAVSPERSEIVVIQDWEAGLKAATPK